MIRYSCPRCKSILESPDHKAGYKITCPKCQQRLQIPGPPRDRTVLAVPVLLPDPLPQAIPIRQAPAETSAQNPFEDLDGVEAEEEVGPADEKETYPCAIVALCCGLLGIVLSAALRGQGQGSIVGFILGPLAIIGAIASFVLSEPAKAMAGMAVAFGLLSLMLSGAR